MGKAVKNAQGDMGALRLALLRDGSSRALGALVTSMDSWIARTAWRYGRAFHLDDAEIEDLISEGRMGCLRAARTFDVERGYQFTTYAQPWIKAYVLQFIRYRTPIKAHSRGVRLVSSNLRLGDDGLGEELQAFLTDHAAGADERLGEEQERSEVRAAVARLTPRRRTVLRMHLAGQGAAAISNALSKREGGDPVSRQRINQLQQQAVDLAEEHVYRSRRSRRKRQAREATR